MSEIVNVTYAELEKLVRRKNKPKQIGYGFRIAPFLPTKEDRGFGGCGIVECEQGQFLSIARDLLRVFEKRGARIALTVPTDNYESFLI